MNSYSSHASEHVFPAVRKLLSLQVRVMFSNFRRGDKKKKLSLIFIWLIILAIIVFIFGISWGLLGFLQSPTLEQVIGDTSLLMEAVPNLVLFGAFFGILITSFGVLLQGLYLAGDMEFLISSPIPIRSVFLAKLLQAILPNFAFVSLFALPVLYGMGAANGFYFLYYPTVLIVLITLALAAAGISSLLVMLLVKIIPPRRIAEVLGFIGAIVAITMSQIGNIINFGDISPESEQIQQTISVVGNFNTSWIPLTWGGRGLISLGNGDWLIAGGLLILISSINLGIFWLSLVTAERWFYTGWSALQIASTKKKSSVRKRPTGGYRNNVLLSWISPNIRAVIWKDLLVLRRDLRNLSQLVTPLIFGVIYSFLLLRNRGDVPTGQGQAPGVILQAIEIALVYSSVGIAIFVGWTLLARLATMSFSHEHQSYWLLKSAPLSSGQLVIAKFFVSFVPANVLGLIFLTTITLLQRAHFNVWVYGVFVIAFCNAGLTGINLAFGIVGAKFDWKDPRKMSNTATGCVSSLVSIIYVLLNLSIFFIPPIAFSAFGIQEIYGQVLGGFLGGAMSIICLVIPLWMVRGRIPILGEP